MATSYERLQDLLRQLGQSIKLPNLKPDKDGYCCLCFDDRMNVHIQLNKNTDNLTVFAELGIVTQGYRKKLFSRMLQANVFWLGSGGATLGFNTQNDMATIGRQVPMRLVDFPFLQKLLEDFVNMVEKWMDLVEKSQDEADDSDSSGQSKPHFSPEELLQPSEGTMEFMKV